MNSFQGKTAIVTGASQGIGRAIVVALAKKRANLVLASRRLSELNRLAKEIVDGGGSATAVQTDVSKISECKALVDKAVAIYGQVDILVNNAGIRVVGSIDSSDPDEIKRMVEVNLLGVYFCTYSVLSHMKKRAVGDIVNISSEVAVRYFPGRPMYSATKAAVRAFSESLGDFVKKWNIRVITVYPGRTDTPMVAEFTEEERGKFLKPEDVASAVIHALEYRREVSLSEILLRPTKNLEDIDYTVEF